MTIGSAGLKTDRSRNYLLLAGVAVVAFAFGLATGHFGLLFDHSPAASAPGVNKQTGATITANPNPVPAGPGMGKTIISWDTGDKNIGEVYVLVNGGQEKMFAGNRSKGTLQANWIGQGKYEFRLYEGKERQKVLATVIVTRFQ